MKELSREQKLTIWQKLTAVVGLSAIEEPVKLADYVAKNGSTITVDDASGEVAGGVADGEIELEDGRTLVIVGGKLETIKDAQVAAADAAPAPAPADAPASQQQQIDALQAQIDELKAQVEQLLAGTQALSAANTELSTQLAAIEATPADKKVILHVQEQPAKKLESMSVAERAVALLKK